MSVLSPVLQPVLEPVLRSPMDPVAAPAIRPWEPGPEFFGGKVGVWLDPSDFSTMFQDAAETVPVTAAGQQVARINNKAPIGPTHFYEVEAGTGPFLQQDEAGRYYLLGNGTNTIMMSTSYSPNSAEVMASMGFVLNERLSNRVIYEHGPNSATSVGSFGIVFLPNFTMRSRGTANSRQVAAVTTAGQRYVCTGSSSIAAPSVTARSNGVQTNQDTVDQGTGGYVPYQDRLFGRSNAPTTHTSGRLYGWLLRYQLATAGELALVEGYMARKTGVAL